MQLGFITYIPAELNGAEICLFSHFVTLLLTRNLIPSINS